MRFSPNICLLVFAHLIGCHAAIAQSTFDLEPPQRKQLPTFACAEAIEKGERIKFFVTLQKYYVQESKIVVSEDGNNEVFSNLVEIKHDDDEIIEHSYQVQVPYQVTVVENGKEVSRVQTKVETRTRRMTRKEASKRRAGGTLESYTIREPYFATSVRDGKRQPIKRFRNVKKSISLHGTQRLVTRPYVETFESTLNNVNFFNADGSKLDLTVALERLAIRRPILLVPHDFYLEPYFQELIQPDTILIHDETWSPIPTN